MTVRPFERILSMAQLKDTAERLGNYFFTPGAMRAFNSHVSDDLFWVNDECGYFVTSEQYVDHYEGVVEPRGWTVRKYKVVRVERDGHEFDRLETDHVGKFQGWASLEGAKSEASKLQGYARLDLASFEMDR